MLLALLGLCIVFHKYFSRSKLYFITKQTNFFLFFQLDKGENEDGVYQASGSANIILYGLAHVIEQPIFRIPNLEFLQHNICFDFF